MVIFYSYVKLPEGKSINITHVEVCGAVAGGVLVGDASLARGSPGGWVGRRRLSAEIARGAGGNAR